LRNIAVLLYKTTWSRKLALQTKNYQMIGRLNDKEDIPKITQIF
jgi:hypothetical protein